MIFTDESRCTLDGPDGWSKIWKLDKINTPIRINRQQKGGCIMIWAGIVDNKIIGPFRIPDGIKINSENYISLLRNNFCPWLEKNGYKKREGLIFSRNWV